MQTNVILAFRNTLRHQRLARRGQISNFRVDIDNILITLLSASNNLSLKDETKSLHYTLSIIAYNAD